MSHYNSSVNLNTGRLEKTKVLIKSHFYDKQKHICITDTCCQNKSVQISLPFTLVKTKTNKEC